MSKKIGVSLSFCIAAICRGEFSIEDVAFIICGTAAKTRGDWERLIKNYQDSYWKQFPTQALDVFNKLQLGDKLFQPRIVFGDKYCPTLINGIWKEHLNDVKWGD